MVYHRTQTVMFSTEILWIEARRAWRFCSFCSLALSSFRGAWCSTGATTRTQWWTTDTDSPEKSTRNIVTMQTGCWSWLTKCTGICLSALWSTTKSSWFMAASRKRRTWKCFRVCEGQRWENNRNDWTMAGKRHYSYRKSLLCLTVDKIYFPFTAIGMLLTCTKISNFSTFQFCVRHRSRLTILISRLNGSKWSISCGAIRLRQTPHPRRRTNAARANGQCAAYRWLSAAFKLILPSRFRSRQLWAGNE